MVMRLHLSHYLYLKDNDKTIYFMPEFLLMALKLCEKL